MSDTDFDVPPSGAWLLADQLAAERKCEPPSDRQALVERVAWALHASRGLSSPRKEWAEMDDRARAELFVAARGAIGMYEAQLREAMSDVLVGDPHVCTCDHTPDNGCPGCSEAFEDRCRFELRWRGLLDGTWAIP